MGADTFQDILKIAVPAGLMAGLVTGVVARIAMRAFALAEGETPSFSIAGTLMILFVFAVILGVPLALLYVRFWPSPGSWYGLAYGLAIFVVAIAIPFLLIPSDDATPRLRLVAILSFLPVPLVYGLSLSQFTQRLISGIPSVT